MDFIITFKNSISEPLCEQIITMFESQHDKHEGLTLSGVNKDTKDTTDYCIPKNDDKWNKIESFLYKELFNKLKKYMNLIENNCEIDSMNNYGIKFNFFYNRNLFTDSFMIQKYSKNIGKYIYHNDFTLHSEINNTYRVLTFLWYLNDVEEGGKTTFFKDYSITPEKGTLLIFPACWCYPHTGKIPISNDKYIITGWLYLSE